VQEIEAQYKIVENSKTNEKAQMLKLSSFEQVGVGNLSKGTTFYRTHSMTHQRVIQRRLFG
jgi:hypothetical protein